MRSFAPTHPIHNNKIEIEGQYDDCVAVLSVDAVPSSPHTQVINERDILGTQLIRRNDELALLYEKIKIQQSTLNKGEAQYTQRVEDIRILKLEIKKMRRERNMLSRSVANIEDLR